MSTTTVTGNLVADPELKFTPSGVAVVNFTILENTRIQKDGEWVDGEPNRFDVEAWRGLAENISISAEKGTTVMVEGHIKTQKWQDRESGENRYRQVLAAEKVGVDLKWQSAKVTKSAGNKADQGEDPWATPSE